MATATEARNAAGDTKIAQRPKGISLITSKLRIIIRRLRETDCDLPDAWRDPLSHPAIRAMSSRELADLPFVKRQR